MTAPKTITAKIVAPEWAKWVATDADNSVYIYKNKPAICETAEGMWCAEGGEYEWIGETTPPRNWRKTLRRVK